MLCHLLANRLYLFITFPIRRRTKSFLHCFHPSIHPSIPIDHPKHYPTWIHITKHPVYIAHEENRSNVSMSRKREPLSRSVIIRNVRALARPTLDVHTMHFSRQLPASLLPWDVSQANQCDAYPEFTGETGWELSGEGWKGASFGFVVWLALFFDEFYIYGRIVSPVMRTNWSNEYFCIQGVSF